MAHELDFSKGRAAFAYVGEKAWHGLGQELKENATLDQWRVAAGFDWEVKSAPLVFRGEGFDEQTIAKRKALYRSDTGACLSTVSDNYRVVQPSEVMGFFDELARAGGFRLETAGCLKGGGVYWALARTGAELKIGGVDVVLPYLLLATSCDKSLSTTAMLTSIRVVCNNTLTYAVEGTNSSVLRIPHSTGFDKNRVLKQFGLIDDSWKTFGERCNLLAETPISDEQAEKFYEELLYPGVEEVDPAKKPALLQLLDTYRNGVGQDVRTARGTVWGVVNAVTRYVDHEKKSASRDNRLTSAWFGSGARLKQEAWEQALKLAA